MNKEQIVEAFLLMSNNTITFGPELLDHISINPDIEIVEDCMSHTVTVTLKKKDIVDVKKHYLGIIKELFNDYKYPMVLDLDRVMKPDAKIQAVRNVEQNTLTLTLERDQ